MRRGTFLSMTSILVLVAGVATAAPQPQVTICHFPPGNPANTQLITVGAPAVPAHLANHNDAVCPAGSANCCFGGSHPSLCTNFATDANNCGACGNACSAGASCIGGSCVAATATNTATPVNTATPTNTPAATATATDTPNPCAGVSCGDCNTCNPATGGCVAVPDNTACGDGGSCCAGSCACAAGDVCSASICTSSGCTSYQGLGCYWLSNEPGTANCWLQGSILIGFPGTINDCKNLDSCNGGGGASGGGCYKWANSSDTAIYPPWP